MLFKHSLLKARCSSPMAQKFLSPSQLLNAFQTNKMITDQKMYSIVELES